MPKRVAVRPCVDDVGHQLGQALLHLQVRVPAGVIEKQGRVLLPSRSLVVELAHQVPEERGHHVRVGVGLGQRTPDPAFCVQGSDH